MQLGDEIRLPPIQVENGSAKNVPPQPFLDRIVQSTLYENEELLVLNKPQGMAVHAGSGVDYGVIEGLRALRGTDAYMELVHRLDRDTSGCLLLAKRRQLLVYLHELLRTGQLSKRYLLLVKGHWQGGERIVDAPLLKNQSRSGERMVMVDDEGREAQTRFQLVKLLDDNMSLLCASPLTGRTHQIRVHAAHIGYPILGDRKYGDNESNRRMRERGYSHLFLHAYQLAFAKPDNGEQYRVKAPLLESWLSLFSEEDLACLEHLNY